jgi:UPF0716 protein FxsA
MGRLILLFTLVPFVELALLIWIGDRIGFLPTVALILATGVLGASLARLQGLATWARFRRALEAGRLPGSELIEGLMILVAGAVLLTPGILTDLAGFALLVPAVRRLLVRWAEPRIRSRVTVRGTGPGRASGPTGPGAFRSRTSPDGEVIDAEYEILDPDRPGEGSGAKS